MSDLTFDAVRNPLFLDGLRRLFAYDGWSPKTAYHVNRVCKALDPEIGTANDLFKSMVKKYAQLDDKGEIVPPEGRPLGYTVPPEKKDEFQKALAEFNATELTVSFTKIPADALEGVPLSPGHLAALEPLIDWGDMVQ